MLPLIAKNIHWGAGACANKSHKAGEGSEEQVL